MRSSITEEDLQQVERRLAGFRDAFPPDMKFTPNAIGLSRLDDTQCLIEEVRRLLSDLDEAREVAREFFKWYCSEEYGTSLETETLKKYPWLNKEQMND
jgi:hypothetical protein